MAEKFISKRVQFHSGKQRFFLERCRIKMHMKNGEFANFLKIHIRTLTDWKREKFLIPYTIVIKLSKINGIALPRGTSIRDKFRDVTRAAHLGGIAIVKKYGTPGGDPEKRKIRWKQWWKREGKFLFKKKKLGKRKNIHIPLKTDKLAEFVGIMLGDGGISKHQVTVSLNGIDDAAYAEFVIKLLKKLFGVSPGIYRKSHEKAIRIVLSRTDLVDFCCKIGLKIGNKIKQHIDIPKWVQHKEAFRKVCLRGLIDTDGCLVIHRYRVKGKIYIYKKINFSSASPPLIKSVVKILKDFGFHPRISSSRRQVWLDSKDEVEKYMSVIGTSNDKHRFRFSGEVPKRL